MARSDFFEKLEFTLTVVSPLSQKVRFLRIFACKRIITPFCELTSSARVHLNRLSLFIVNFGVSNLIWLQI
jgi:hypothetical protein